jgi:hypothetical protein
MPAPTICRGFVFEILRSNASGDACDSIRSLEGEREQGNRRTTACEVKRLPRVERKKYRSQISRGLD